MLMKFICSAAQVEENEQIDSGAGMVDGKSEKHAGVGNVFVRISLGFLG